MDKPNKSPSLVVIGRLVKILEKENALTSQGVRDLNKIRRQMVTPCGPEIRCTPSRWKKETTLFPDASSSVMERRRCLSCNQILEEREIKVT